MSNWDIVRIKDITKEVGKRNKDYRASQVLSVSNKHGFVRPDQLFDRQVASSDISNYKVVNRGEFAYNPSRLLVGSLAYLENYDKGALSPMYVVFKTNDKVVDKYLFYWLFLEETKNKFKASVQGSVRDTVPYKDLSEIQISLPPISEQKKIANILISIDEVIESTEKEIIKLQQLRKGMMQELLTKGVGHTQFKDSPVGSIPESWSYIKVGDIIEIKHGYAYESQYFQLERTKYFLMTPGHFYEEGGFKDIGSKQKYYKGPIYEDYNLKPGDVLIAMTEQASGLLGSTAIVPDFGIFLHNQRLGKVIVKDNKKLSLRFSELLLNSSIVRKEIDITGTGTKVRHTSPQKIYDAYCLLPPLSEQNDIINIMDSLYTKLKLTHEKQNKNYDLKKGLMQDLLTGKVRVKV
jgi:type I restriction enzyme S subunit